MRSYPFCGRLEYASSPRLIPRPFNQLADARAEVADVRRERSERESQAIKERDTLQVGARCSQKAG